MLIIWLRQGECVTGEGRKRRRRAERESVRKSVSSDRSCVLVCARLALFSKRGDKVGECGSGSSKARERANERAKRTILLSLVFSLRTHFQVLPFERATHVTLTVHVVGTWPPFRFRVSPPRFTNNNFSRISRNVPPFWRIVNLFRPRISRIRHVPGRSIRIT